MIVELDMLLKLAVVGVLTVVVVVMVVVVGGVVHSPSEALPAAVASPIPKAWLSLVGVSGVAESRLWSAVSDTEYGAMSRRVASWYSSLTLHGLCSPERRFRFRITTLVCEASAAGGCGTTVILSAVGVLSAEGSGSREPLKEPFWEPRMEPLVEVAWCVAVEASMSSDDAVSTSLSPVVSSPEASHESRTQVAERRTSRRWVAIHCFTRACLLLTPLYPETPFSGS